MKIDEFTAELTTLVMSGQSMMYVNTREENRVAQAIREAGWLAVPSGRMPDLAPADLLTLQTAMRNSGLPAEAFQPGEKIKTALLVEAYRQIMAAQKHTDEEQNIANKQTSVIAHVLDRISYPTIVWDGLTGLQSFSGQEQYGGTDFIEAMHDIIGETEKPSVPKQCIVIMRDCHRILGAEETTSGRRALRNVYEDNRLVSGQIRRHVVFTQPYMNPHQDIRHCLSRLEFPLPDDQAIDRAITFQQEGLQSETAAVCSAELRKELITAMRGLDIANIDKVLSYCLVEFGGFVPEREIRGTRRRLVTAVRTLRSRQLSSGQGLRIIDPDDPELTAFGALSGWERIREMADRVRFCRSRPDNSVKIEAPNGFALAGPPGVGKSVCAKLFAKWLDVPCVMVNMGSLKEGIVGASEHNMALAIQTIRAIGDCVVFLDEWDKQSSGIVNGANDGNTSSSMLSQILDFANDPYRKAFLIIAMNRLTGPVESVRAGRVTHFFYVPLPDAIDREEILQLKIAERGGKILEKDVAKIAQDSVTGGLSGAELTVMVNTAMILAAMRGRDGCPDAGDLQAARDLVTPVTQLDSEEVNAMAQFEKKGAVSVNVKKQRATEPAQLIKRSIRVDPGNN